MIEKQKNKHVIWWQRYWGMYTVEGWVYILLLCFLFFTMGFVVYGWQFDGGKERAEKQKATCDHCVCVPEPRYP